MIRRTFASAPALFALLVSCASPPSTDSPTYIPPQSDAAPAKDASAPDAAIDASTDAAHEDARAEDAAPLDAAKPVDPAIEQMHARADEALAQLMLTFWPALRANTTVYDWMYAHEWEAVLDAAERRGPNAFAGTARMFFELQKQRGWLDGFYDDENWVTLALLHAYRVTGETMYLDQAKVVFADIMKAWDETCCGTHKGGLFWKKPAENKVTAINAGAVISASLLYEGTHDAAYLAFAKKAYAFWSTTMVDKATGHVYDGMDNQGNINTTWHFTYNEGLFIGAIVALAKVTNDNSQIPLAHKVASYMLTNESATTSVGTILSDGKCSGDGEMFKAVGARYLGELYALDPSHTEYRDILQRSADAAWTLARNTSSGLIACDWAGPFNPDTAHVGSLGSAAVGLAAAAKALGASAARPALTYEAEEGNLHGLGLEASHAGFSGWAYLAGWGTDGQSVDFFVDAPSAGTYDVELRYATGDAAARTIAVDGTDATASLAFPSTGDYDTYKSVTTSVTLAKGANRLSVGYVTAKGGRGYINLDRVALTKK